MNWLRLGVLAPASPAAAQSDNGNFRLGVETRIRYEGLRGNEWGAAEVPDDGYIWSRLMPRAEVKEGPIRGFVELIAAYRIGSTAKKGPVDETGIPLNDSLRHKPTFQH